MKINDLRLYQLVRRRTDGAEFRVVGHVTCLDDEHTISAVCRPLLDVVTTIAPTQQIPLADLDPIPRHTS